MASITGVGRTPPSSPLQPAPCYDRRRVAGAVVPHTSERHSPVVVPRACFPSLLEYRSGPSRAVGQARLRDSKAWGLVHNGEVRGSILIRSTNRIND